jgi:hypothetical protein
MGRLIYARELVIEIDDRPLAHLRIVVMTKLRRGEPFMLQLPDPMQMGMRSLWVAPAVPIALVFAGGRVPAIDPHWLDELITEAGSANGLTLPRAVTSPPPESALSTRVEGGALRP